MTIDEFAATAGVSVATANCFARALELFGYPQFRAELACGFEAALEPVEKLRVELAHSASAVQIFAATSQEDIQNAQHTLQSLDGEGACERAMASLLQAERVFIIGFGASGYLTGLLQHSLCMHLHSVESLAGPGGVSQLVLTDWSTSPLAPCATVALYTPSARQFSANAGIAALGLIEALSAAVAHRAKDSIKAALGVTESVMPWLIHGVAGTGKR